MTLGAIVQARMSSRRLPGKVLIEVGGRTILEHVLARLRGSTSLATIVVATSSDPSDDAIEAVCARNDVRCHRGPLDDVAARFAEAMTRYRLEAFVRVNADSPLLDPAVVDRVVAAFRPGIDLATNVHPRTFPPGQSVEVVAADAFRTALALMEDPADREHVTRAMYRHPDVFTIHNVRSDEDLSRIRMVVDGPADLDTLTRVFSRMTRPVSEYHLPDLVRLYEDAGSIGAAR